MKILKMAWRHFGERNPRKTIHHLVVHCFAFPIDKNLKLWNQLGVGTHYLIDQKGHITQLVAENKVAWHAGKSFWKKESGLNTTSIGIELYSPSFGQKKYPAAQINAFKKLALDIIRRYHIRPENIVGHSDVAPARKVDPGVAFPWAKMAQIGIGLWTDEQKTNVSHAKVSTLLKRIGYDVTNEKAAVLAFLRHFMPEQVVCEKDVIHAEDNLVF